MSLVAVVLLAGRAILAVGAQAAAALCTDTDAVANLDILDIAADTDRLANDFMANTAS